MVLADSGRIARVPPYLGTPLGQDPVSATGLSPSMARLSRRLAYQIPVLNAVPQPRRSFLRRFGLFRFRSPLLAESSFLSFPRGTKMFHFPRFARTRLWIQRAVRRHYPPEVSPFENLRIKAWLAAPRSLSQLPASFIASCRLGIHRVPFLAWSSSLPAPLSRCGRRRRPRSSPVAHPWVNKGRSRHTLCLLFLRICSCQRTGPAGAWLRRSSADRIRCGGLERGSLQLARQSSGADRDRTDDIQLAKLALSQLSYGPIRSGGRMRLPPVPPGVRRREPTRPVVGRQK